MQITLSWEGSGSWACHPVLVAEELGPSQVRFMVCEWVFCYYEKAPQRNPENEDLAY